MKTTRLLLGASALLAFSPSSWAFNFDAYGSLRLGVETVHPKGHTNNDYSGLRDAYSRVGVKISEQLKPNWKLTGQLEIPLDLANLKVQSPYDNNDHVRIAKLQLNSPLGTLWYGHGWMAYYNYIAYPLDQFSSYYSGWATLTTFRRGDTWYYASPSFGGFSIAYATTNDNGGASTNRDQYVLSYSHEGLKLAAGLDDNVGNADSHILGFTASYTTGPWYLAAKYEHLHAATPSGNNVAENILAAYQIDKKNLVRGMLAYVGNGYGGTSVTLGWDHQYNKSTKFWVNYYQESHTAAISKSNHSFPPGGGFIQGVSDGGKVLTAGVRYDF